MTGILKWSRANTHGEVQRSKLIELSTLAFTFISHTISVSDETEVRSVCLDQTEFYIQKQLKSIESWARERTLLSKLFPSVLNLQD